MVVNKRELKKRVHTHSAETPLPPLVPSFYVCPYADSAPGQSTDYSLTRYPSGNYDVNLAFFTLNDNIPTGNFGNTIDDTFLCHLRDRPGIQSFITAMQKTDRRIFNSFIDTPNIDWSSANIENFVRNTEGEIGPDGTIFTSNLMQYYPAVGRMWDAETPASPDDFAAVMMDCFLHGITRDPENYVFIYTTYADRSIDQLLNKVFDAANSPTEAALIELGFLRFTDLFTKRGPNLSWIETMSYGGTASSRFAEADNYAVKYLAQGDATRLNEMRKYLSIGVAPGLTSQSDAVAIGSACDPSKEEGYGRFMVWAGNCPDGVSLFDSMISARELALTPLLPKGDAALEAVKANLPFPRDARSGNRARFFSKQHMTDKQPTVADIKKIQQVGNDKPEESWLSRMTCGLISSCC